MGSSYWTFFVSSMLITILLSIVCLVMIYVHVRKTEKRSTSWTDSRRSTCRNSRRSSMIQSTLIRTKLVAKQCLLFFVVLTFPWTFHIINVVSIYIFDHWIPEVHIIGYCLVPSSGFLNCLVYFRMRYFRLRIEHPDTSKKRIIFGIVRDNLFPCWCKDFTFQSRSSEDGKDLEPALNGDGQDESEAQIDHFTDNSGNENSSH
uniref:G-protein coupled receptors family 1 profile domain-containing protein n=1 Tax=Ditylum brightwellii TaxID=49249 RepID=A0A7S4T116_9STRA